MNKKTKKKNFVQEVAVFENEFKVEWKNILFNFLIMFFSMFFILFFKTEIIVSILLLFVAIIGLVKWKSKVNVIIFLFFGLIFGFAETFISSYGAWEYRMYQIGIVPAWLFILWGITATFIYQMTLEIKKIWRKM